MKNIWTIFKTDFHNIRTRKAAIIVVVALMILPSMYAWFNIIPSWDPYANTKDVPVAIVNLDEGAEVEGKPIHVGGEVVKSLEANQSLGWQFVSKREALQGVEYGDYYASIIIPENFSEKLTSVLGDVPEQPILDYYINEKINAIAPKVTGAGASGIVDKIQSGFVKVTNEAMFTAFNKIGIDLQANRETIDKFKTSIYQLEGNLPEITQLLEQADTDLTRVENAVVQAHDGIEKVEKVSEDAKALTTKITNVLEEGNERIQSEMPNVLEVLQSVQTVLQDISTVLENLPNHENELANSLDGLSINADQVTERINNLQALHDLLENVHQKLTEEPMIDQVLTTMNEELSQTRALITTTEATINALKNGQSHGDTIDQVQGINGIDIEAIQSLENQKEVIEHLQRLLTQLNERETMVQSVINNMAQLKNSFESEGFLQEMKRVQTIQQEIESLYEQMLVMVNKVQEGQASIHELRTSVENGVNDVNRSITETLQFLQHSFMPKYEKAYKKASNALQTSDEVLTKVLDSIPRVNALLEQVSEGVVKGREGLAYVRQVFPEAKEKVLIMANRIRNLEESGDLDQLIHLLKNDPQIGSEFFANPILLNEHELFPIPNYGSAMAPFFTAMSLWVGGLILVSSLFVDVPNKQRYKSYETYGGRLLSFWVIGLAQALIVTTGNIFLLKTHVTHKVMYILFAFLISTAFVIIVYTFVSVFGNTGKVIAIILLVMQLGASGGTFPIVMTPIFFQKIHGFLPFTHALGLFREAVGGIIWPIVWKHTIWLLGYMSLFLFIGLKLKERINKSTDKFLEEARESEIIS